MFSCPEWISPCISVNNQVLDLEIWEDIVMDHIYHLSPSAPGRTDGQTVLFSK
jgi:hypothetical protein